MTDLGIILDVVVKILGNAVLSKLEPLHGDEVKALARAELYASDEAFLCGTGGEVTPITSVDDIRLRQVPRTYNHLHRQILL